jgi:hypothetical protein
MSYELIVPGSILLSCFFVSWSVRKVLSSYIQLKKRSEIIRNYDTYKKILDQCTKEAYERVYKDEILAYSSSGYSLDIQTFNETCKKFISLTLKYLGKEIQEDLNLLHGKDTLLYHLTEQFLHYYEEDKIRDMALLKAITPQDQETGVGPSKPIE